MVDLVLCAELSACSEGCSLSLFSCTRLQLSSELLALFALSIHPTDQNSCPSWQLRISSNEYRHAFLFGRT